jgi:hypothetical protein
MESKGLINRLRYENFRNAEPWLLKYKPRCYPLFIGVQQRGL